MNMGASFSSCRKYRYSLWRIWDETKPIIMFVGLNPSTADETKDDPTVAKCQQYARQWGNGGILMANIFAYRATDPLKMKAAKDPIGPDNDESLIAMASRATRVIAAWGNHGTHLNRSQCVKKLLPSLHYLKMNKTGEPAHPLYLSYSLSPITWSDRQLETTNLRRPYLVIFPNGDSMVADFAFFHKDGGICFVDVGWNVPGRHPFHIVNGPVKRESGQTVCGNGTVVRELKPEDKYWHNWQCWLNYKNSPEGAGVTNECAIEHCERDGALIDQPL